MKNHPQEKLMQEAIAEAKRSASLRQYSIGALVVAPDGEIISTGHTTTHLDNDATAHAEINVIREACLKLKDRYLVGCWLYTTLEPCPMCTSAAIWAKMEGIVFGATKEDAQEQANKITDGKFTWRQIDISSKNIIEKGNPKVELVEKFMREECNHLFDFTKNEG